MGQVKDLNNGEAIAKLRDIVAHNRSCLFHSGGMLDSQDSRPMTVQEVCDQGNLWMFSARSSTKNVQIKAEPRVLLTMADTGRSEYLVIHGEASIVDDQARKERLWNSFLSAWFPEGVNDPELTLIKVMPIDCRYWDTTDGKLYSLLKIAGAAITGTMNDSGSVMGKINV
jgi:general stress protein 26